MIKVAVALTPDARELSEAVKFECDILYYVDPEHKRFVVIKSRSMKSAVLDAVSFAAFLTNEILWKDMYF